MSMQVRKAMYVDTQLLVFAHAHARRGCNAPDHAVFKKGRQFEECLGICREKDVRVFTSWFTFLELQNGYVGCGKRKYWVVDLGLPIAVAFGGKEDRRELDKKGAIPSAVMDVLRAEINEWLDQWPFREVVQFDFPRAPLWSELARIIMRYVEVSPSDCLHLSAAMALECDFFMTEDSGLRRVLDRLRKDADFLQEVSDMNMPGIPRVTRLRSFQSVV